MEICGKSSSWIDGHESFTPHNTGLHKLSSVSQMNRWHIAIKVMAAVCPLFTAHRAAWFQWTSERKTFIIVLWWITEKVWLSHFCNNKICILIGHKTHFKQERKIAGCKNHHSEILIHSRNIREIFLSWCLQVKPLISPCWKPAVAYLWLPGQCRSERACAQHGSCGAEERVWHEESAPGSQRATRVPGSSLTQRLRQTPIAGTNAHFYKKSTTWKLFYWYNYQLVSMWTHIRWIY